MKKAMDNKGGVLIILLAVIAGAAFGIFMTRDFDAEAVIGGVGNLTLNEHPHNFAGGSAGANAPGFTQICVFCHTPHHAVTDTSLINAPLWNHRLSQASYNMTNLQTGDPKGTGFINFTTMGGEGVWTIDGASKMCLSCHDGTVAIGDVYYSSQTIPTVVGPDISAGKIASTHPTAYFGTTLDHGAFPFSIPMNDTLKADILYNCAFYGGEGTILTKYPWETPDEQPERVFLRPTAQKYKTVPGIEGGSIPLTKGYKAGYNYGVQCSTCHDPHLYWTGSDDSSCYFLVAGSDCYHNGPETLCNACHQLCP